MKLSDIKGEAALDAVADLIDPIAEIAQDKILVGLIRLKNYSEAIKLGIKKYKKSILTILAVLNQEDAKTFEPSLVEIPVMLMEVFNDPAFASLFPSQVQSKEETSSGPAMVNTEANEN